MASGQEIHAKKSLQQIRKLYDEIWPDLEAVEKIIRGHFRSESPYIEGLLDHLTRFAGKRIRPALLLLCARATGGVTDMHHRLGAAVEMLHNATLVHDDVLDEALVRRRYHTLNRVWDNEQAIIFGDFIFAKTFTLIASLGEAVAFRTMTEAAHQICTGELMQLSKKYQPDLDESEYLRMIGLKTASLFEASCRLGALGNAVPPGIPDALGEYGRNLGIAFQIVDDCLDIVGEENVIGKSLGTDLTKGKITLPVIRMLRSLSPKEAQRVREIVAQADHEHEKRTEIGRRVRELDLVPACVQTARDHVWAAKQALSGLGEGPGTRALHDIAEFVIARVH